MVVYENKEIEALEMKCYLLVDDSDDKAKVSEVSLKDIEHCTQLKFLNRETMRRLKIAC